jgi:hypothetical protein
MVGPGSNNGGASSPTRIRDVGTTKGKKVVTGSQLTSRNQPGATRVSLRADVWGRRREASPYGRSSAADLHVRTAVSNRGRPLTAVGAALSETFPSQELAVAGV